MLSLKVKKLIHFFLKNYITHSKTINHSNGYDFYAHSLQLVFYRSFIQSSLKKEGASVMVVATKKGMQKLAFSFKSLGQKNEVVLITKRWVGGFLTNKIYSEKKPSAIIIVGYKEHTVALNEAKREGIPVICFCSASDMRAYGLATQNGGMFVLCNTDCARTVWSYLYVLFK